MSWLGFLPETSQGLEALHLPGWLRFECTACGRCCDSGWSVPVTPVIAAGIEASTSAQAVRREGYLPLCLSAEGQRTMLGKRGDGICVFLDSENLCTLHAELGEARKPLVCQVYPFDLTETPDGYYAALSFACPAVLAGVGPSVEKQRPSLQRLLLTHGKASPKRGRLAERVGWTREQTGSWREYLAFEEQLLGRMSEVSVADALLEAAWALTLGADRSDSKSGPAALLPESVRGALEEFLLDFVVSMLAVLQAPEDLEAQREFGTALRYAPPAHFAPLAVGLGSLTFPGQLSLIEEEVLERYAISHIFGKRLLRGSLLEGVLTLLTCSLLLRTLLGGLSVERGCPKPSFEDLDRVFCLVETEVLTHSGKFAPLFAECEQRFSQTVAGMALG